MPDWAIILIIVASVAIIAIIALIIILKNKNKTPRIIIDDEFTNNLINIFGGKTNITSVNVDNGRLKIEVNDLDLTDLTALKEIATSGVFVTGNIIKTLFKLDSMAIKKALDKAL